MGIIISISGVKQLGFIQIVLFSIAASNFYRNPAFKLALIASSTAKSSICVPQIKDFYPLLFITLSK
jgi:hypothetical protein